MAIKHAMLPKDVLAFFDFAAMNPMQSSLMRQQVSVPMVLLQSLEQQERDMQFMGGVMAEEAEKVAQQQHEERQEINTGSEESVATEEISTTSFNLVYYNPETKKAEVIKEEVRTNVSDYMQKQKVPGTEAQTSMAVDQSVGQKSTHALYMNVATPLSREVVDPVKLEAALSKIEVESPKPFGGAAAVPVPKQVFDRVEQHLENEGLEQEVVAVNALREVEDLREETIHQVDSQISSFEEVIEELEVTDDPMENVIEKLPPLSSKRYLALLREEKEIAETLLVDMLIADLEFLVVLKKNLKKMGLKDLLKTLGKLGKLPALGALKKEGGGDEGD
ncbi:hypothetical protein GF415_02760 [Candidatus Micrarchaeota archaeon]|nr:hypothetical protein [Candidatus Micrarchaeota archaeon]